MKKIKWKILAVSLIIVYSVAFLGSLFTSSSVNSAWYDSVKSSLTPPNWVFPIVWNFLFFLIALSLYISWIHANKKEHKKLIVVFGINLFLNFLWSIIFFALRNPAAAFFELVILWLSIIVMICATFRISKLSSWLLVPYLLWVSFAGFLNYLIAFR